MLFAKLRATITCKCNLMKIFFQLLKSLKALTCIVIDKYVNAFINGERLR